MRPSTTARRYAEAAFAVAHVAHAEQQWMKDLTSATRAIGDTNLSEYFRDPGISEAEQMQTIERAFGSLQPQVQNLLRILVLRHRLYLLPQITREFEALEREARGVTEASVTVARPIDEAERKAVADRLGRLTGKQVEVHVKVDPSILGGVVVRIGDRLIDASV